MKSYFSIAVAVLLLAGCIKAKTPEAFGHGNVYYDYGIDAQIPIAKRIVNSAKIYRPDGPGPFPAMIILHGSHGAGKESLYGYWAEYYLKKGFIVLRPDSFSSRGPEKHQMSWVDRGSLKDAELVVTTGPYPIQVRAIDAFVALDWLKNQPYVDPTKIFLHGHSHGAATILHVFSIVDPTGSDNTFAGGVAVSPLCGTFSDSENLRGPIVIFHGSKDRNAVTHECVIYRNDDAVGKNIYFEILEGASHNPTIDNSNKNYHPAMKEPLERFIEGIID
jgi:dienelactone hydrolase